MEEKSNCSIAFNGRGRAVPHRHQNGEKPQENRLRDSRRSKAKDEKPPVVKEGPQADENVEAVKKVNVDDRFVHYGGGSLSLIFFSAIMPTSAWCKSPTAALRSTVAEELPKSTSKW